jgi:hypothetical protein
MLIMISCDLRTKKWKLEEIAYKFYFRNSEYQFKAVMRCGPYGTYGLKQNLYTYEVLMVKAEGRRPLRRPRHGWKNNIKETGIIPVVRNGGVGGTTVKLNLDIM